ncbi:TPA: integrase [Escherichia coli]|nr:integrase [Escherichia coli]HBA9582212.1 integrase [Escherichia coli]HBA9586330.1 integrase [Escherichia coli]
MSLVDATKVLNRFSDYFETQLSSDGRRYYIRTHQMRRFFAMTFFWNGGFGGLDTLRWFLGHTNLEHVYHYITEAVPGEVLRRVSAEYASEALVSRQSNSKSLGALLEERYGVSTFSIMQSDEVADYIEDLIIEGILKIEPVFYDTPDGNRYEILFKIMDDKS